MDSAKLTLILHISRKYVAPVLVGALVVWLVTHEFMDWAIAVCSVADALAIYTKDCMELTK